MKGLINANMPPEEEMPPPEEAQDGQRLGREENLDVEIGYALGKTLLDSPPGEQALEKAMNAGGQPGAALGLMLSQMIEKIQNKMDESPMPLSPRIWLSQNGVVDRWMEDLEIPPEVAQGAKDEILEQIKLIAQQQQAPPQQQQMPPQEMM